MRCVSQRWRFLSSHKVIWKRLTQLLTLGKQQSIVQPLMQTLKTSSSSNNSINWRDVYWNLTVDGKRSRITEAELVSLSWAFSDGERTVSFQSNNTLKMEGYPEMIWSINPENGAVIIHNFPEHQVERLTNFGWVLKNQFIFILTIDPVKKKSSTDTNTATDSSTSSNKEQINKAFELARRMAGNQASPLAWNDAAAFEAFVAGLLVPSIFTEDDDSSEDD